MSRALLIVPPFWDPVCVPLGISSLGAHARARGHEVHLFDFNALPNVFSIQRAYFQEARRQFPFWADWNIERNGTDTLAFHQLLYLRGRNLSHYHELVGELLNLDQRDPERFLDRIDFDKFD